MPFVKAVYELLLYGRKIVRNCVPPQKRGLEA
jgi:hypothetical protein